MSNTTSPLNISLKINKCSLFKSTILLANLVEHFDTSLYGFMAPVIGRALFPNEDPITQLILVYGALGLGILARPLGGIYFSSLAIKSDPFFALILSLMGVGIATFLIGFLPETSGIWYLAPIMLILSRTLMGFSAAGENAIAPYYLLDGIEDSNKMTLSGVYQGSTMLGILIAAGISSLLLSSDLAEKYWRIIFLMSGFACIGTIFLRFWFRDLATLQKINREPKLWLRIKQHLPTIIMLIPIYGFSYLTYSITLVFLNPYLDLLKVMELSGGMIHATQLMIIDAICCPLVCIVIRKIPTIQSLQASLGVYLLSAAMLFFALPEASVAFIYLMRLVMVISGVVFSATLIPWCYALFDDSDRYLINAVSYSVGTETLGRMAPAICFCLYEATKRTWSPLLLLIPVTILALFCLFSIQLGRMPDSCPKSFA